MQVTSFGSHTPPEGCNKRYWSQHAGKIPHRDAVVCPRLYPKVPARGFAYSRESTPGRWIWTPRDHERGSTPRIPLNPWSDSQISPRLAFRLVFQHPPGRDGTGTAREGGRQERPPSRPSSSSALSSDAFPPIHRPGGAALFVTDDLSVSKSSSHPNANRIISESKSHSDLRIFNLCFPDHHLHP